MSPVPEEPPGAAVPVSRRVLIVEDNVDAADSLEILIQIWGHQVKAVHDGPAGLEATRTFDPDIVLCDIGLPGGMDGYEVARQARSQGCTARLVALTGYGLEDDQQRARAAGFDLHLTKPVDPNALKRLLAV